MDTQPHVWQSVILYRTFFGSRKFSPTGIFPTIYILSHSIPCTDIIFVLCDGRQRGGGAQRPGLHVKELKIRVRAARKNPLVSNSVKRTIPSAIYLLRMSGSPVKLPSGQKGRGSGDIRTLLPSGWRRISNSGIVGKRDRKDCPPMRFQSTAGYLMLEENRLADSKSW
jgi:hypothetical protein